MTPMVDVQPVEERERIHALDALRGIALLGILMVNMGAFKGLSTIDPFPAVERLAEVADRIAYALIQTLFTNKFYPIFAFLFGLGFALQIGRLQARGVNPTGIMLRRLLILLVIGLLHGLFIWAGDVLFIYAVCGMGLLLFRNLSPRAVLYWVLGLWGVQSLCCLCGSGFVFLGAQFENASAQGDFFQPYIQRGYQVYAHGSYWEAQQFRFVEWLLMLTFTIFYVPNVVTMFLLGLYFGKVGVFEQIASYRRLLLWLAGVGLLLGLPLNALCGWGLLRNISAEEELMAYGWLTLLTVAGPILSLGYIGAFGWLWAGFAGLQRALQPVAAAGRMALTNYLLQSVICTLLFYGYGLGLYDTVGIAQGVGLTVLIWLVQVVLSTLWLARFQYGPMEWLWRSLTYGKRMAMRRPAENG